MATYYVTTVGNDSNTGLSWPQAWLTVSKALTTATAGDEVVFGDGIWDCGGGYSTFGSGSVGSYITFRASNPLGAEWQVTSDDPLLNMSSVDYVRFWGLKMKGLLTTSWALVYLDGCTYVEMNGCELYNTSSRIVCARNACDHISVLNSLLHNDIGDSEADPVDAIALAEAGTTITNILVEGCTIYNAPHSGILWGDVDGLTIQDCIIHDNDSHGVNCQGGDNIVIRGNRIYRNGFWDASGFQDTRGIYVVDGANIEICFNDVYENMGPGFSVDDTTPGPLDVHDNTFYDNDQYPADYGSIFLHDNEGGQDPTIVFENNIVVHTQSGTRTMVVEKNDGDDTWTNLTFDYNLYQDTAGGEDIVWNGTAYGTFAAYLAGHEANSIADDPEFVDAGEANFTLQLTSPAIDEGIDGWGEDYNGAAPDIGAHETGEPAAEPGKVWLCVAMDWSWWTVELTEAA